MVLPFNLRELFLASTEPVQKGVGSSRHVFFKSRGGFPGGAVVENLPADAGDTGSSPGLGGSHMLEQLGP